MRSVVMFEEVLLRLSPYCPNWEELMSHANEDWNWAFPRESSHAIRVPFAQFSPSMAWFTSYRPLGATRISNQAAAGDYLEPLPGLPANGRVVSSAIVK